MSSEYNRCKKILKILSSIILWIFGHRVVVKMERHKVHKNVKKENAIEAIGIFLIVGVALIILFNQWQIWSISAAIENGNGMVTQTASQKTPLQSTGDPVQDAINAVISTGVPDIYGAELGISFDEPVAGMNVLAKFDTSLKPSGEALQRYIKAGTSISCEFCCGAKSITTQNGQAACGCAHSAAMRGLAKYLAINHGSEYTDEQILEELIKWKSLFFPKQMIQRFLDAQADGGNADLSSLNVPSMVGGC